MRNWLVSQNYFLEGWGPPTPRLRRPKHIINGYGRKINCGCLRWACWVTFNPIKNYAYELSNHAQTAQIHPDPCRYRRYFRLPPLVYDQCGGAWRPDQRQPERIPWNGGPGVFRVYR